MCPGGFPAQLLHPLFPARPERGAQRGFTCGSELSTPSLPHGSGAAGAVNQQDLGLFQQDLGPFQQDSGLSQQHFGC